MKDQMIRKQDSTYLSTSSSLAIHKDSHSIFKAKPKIRIIHILSPEIIKTDVANFRELVQRLTGKPTDDKVKKPTSVRKSEELNSTLMTKKVDNLKTGGIRDRVLKEEEDMCFTDNNSSGFLDDLEGFIQDLGHEFPSFLSFDDNCFMYGCEGTHQLD